MLMDVREATPGDLRRGGRHYDGDVMRCAAVRMRG